MPSAAGYIGYTRSPASSPGSASGVWSITEAQQYKRLGQWPWGLDPYFQNVQFQLNFDGEGTSVSDSGPTGRAISVVGSATQSDTQSKFGGKSLYCPGSGSGVKVTTADNAFDLKNNIWTIEMWVFPLSLQNANLAIVSGANLDGLGESGFKIYLSSDGKVYAKYLSGAVTTQNLNYAANAWQHIAVVKPSSSYSSSISIYINGLYSGAGTPYSQFAASVGNGFGIGFGNNWFGNDHLNGYIDGFRFTTGVARYTGNFTPPETPF